MLNVLVVYMNKHLTKRIKRLQKRATVSAQEFLDWLLIPYRGSNRVSLLLRKKIEAIRVSRLIGASLTGTVLFSAVIIPQATDLVTSIEVDRTTTQTIIEITPTTDTKLQWPMPRFGMTTRFSTGHPGIDLTDPVGTPIHPIANGWVAWTNSLPLGYGNHILVEHDNGTASLYAHLSKMEVKSGDTVSATTQLGQVGATG